jgi:hypothetical protein
MLRPLRRFLQDSHGFVVSTETVILLAVVLCGLAVAVDALRTAARNYFVDEVNAIAACSNQVEFNPMDGPVAVRTTPDFDTLFPALQDHVTPPTPTAASKEQD